MGGAKQGVGEPDRGNIQYFFLRIEKVWNRFPFSHLAFLSLIPPPILSIPIPRVGSRALEHEQGEATRDESATATEACRWGSRLAREKIAGLHAKQCFPKIALSPMNVLFWLVENDGSNDDKNQCSQLSNVNIASGNRCYLGRKPATATGPTLNTSSLLCLAELS